MCFCFFFFKQKTAYEMRISDWSSDVCSSYLPFSVTLGRSGIDLEIPVDRSILEVLRDNGIRAPSSCESGTCGSCRTRLIEGDVEHRDMEIGRASCRERVCQYVWNSVVAVSLKKKTKKVSTSSE